MTESLTERLVEILARAIDEEARVRVCLHIVDWLGCAVLGATSQTGSALLAYGRAAPDGPCFSLGVGRKSAEAAAFVNGGLGNIFEMDDLHRTSIVHPGDVVIPAALAVAERVGATGPVLLDAIVRGYEAAIRVGEAAGTGHYAHWYNTATCGVFGAAVAAASVLGLGRPQIVDALGQAGMQSAGLWQCRLEPTFSKQLATARAAQSGVISADLAAIGFPGAKAILEGALGFFAATCPGSDPQDVVHEPDGPWRLFDTSFKPWPACRHAHPVIEAGLALHRLGGGKPIERIEIATYLDAVNFCDTQEPTTPHEARFSLQHCAAVALANGRVVLADFAPSAIADETLATLRRRVLVHINTEMTAAFPRYYGALVSIVYTDGSHEECRVKTAKGDPENPMTEAEIEAKFHTSMSVGGLAARKIEALWQQTRKLPESKTVASFSAALNGIVIGGLETCDQEGNRIDDARQTSN